MTGSHCRGILVKFFRRVRQFRLLKNSPIFLIDANLPVRSVRASNWGPQLTTELMRARPERFAVTRHGSRSEKREAVDGGAQPAFCGIVPLCHCVLPNGLAHGLDLIRNIAVLAEPLFHRVRRRTGQISSSGVFGGLYNQALGLRPLDRAATQGP